MKEKNLLITVLFCSCVFSMSAEEDSNLICGKDIWGPEEATMPSTTDQGSNSQGKQQKWTPLPEADDSNEEGPSLLSPQSGKDIWPNP